MLDSKRITPGNRGDIRLQAHRSTAPDIRTQSCLKGDIYQGEILGTRECMSYARHPQGCYVAGGFRLAEAVLRLAPAGQET